ncbi:Modification methylase AplI [Pseudovibrio sp. Ad5]|uniref:DNA cytosine methyltransferase n=1 Tax=Pseudovibrio sp. Ad5 TaxID=989436 RepID=UPI0007AEC841|nr:DNA cytosine methyltransferase [Pseudovibrio sp. Ad5]KZK96352.1 Modification methylase AplI [Pseudovibrio sp. Ad5]
MKTIEICAGAGGQALGLHNAGAEHVALVEIDKDACETLRRNIKKNALNWGAIFEQDLKHFVENHAANFKGNVDLIAGGVPCPPFSKAGLKLGPKDERDLFPTAIRLIEIVQPKAILLENVEGLLTSEFKAYRQSIKHQLKRLGYFIFWQSIQATDYGVSQKRSRALLVGFKAPYHYHFTWPAPTSKKAPSIGDLLYDLISSRGWAYADTWRKNASAYAPTIVGGSKKHGGPDLGPTRAKNEWKKLGVNAHRIANDDEVPWPDFKNYLLRNGTVRNGYDYMPMLTIQMVARIQGFPDFWDFGAKKTAAYRQVGNAFPPPVAEAIGKSIFDALLRGERENSTELRAAE